MKEINAKNNLKIFFELEKYSSFFKDRIAFKELFYTV